MNNQIGIIENDLKQLQTETSKKQGALKDVNLLYFKYLKVEGNKLFTLINCKL